MTHDPNDIWNRKRPKGNPPNLDEWFKKFFNFKGFNPNRFNGKLPLILMIILIVGIIMWLSMGFYTIQQGEQAVVLRFGKQHGDIVQAGLNWRLIGIDEVNIIDTKVNIRYEIGNKESAERMITKDENIIEILAFVLYRKADPYKYLYNGVDPDESIKQAAMSALREVSGTHKLKELLNTEMEEINTQIKARLEEIIEQYNLGIEIVNFTIEETKITKEVQSAYDDVMSAREQKQTFINEGKKYSENRFEVVKGEAAQIRQKAEKKAISIVKQAEANIELIEHLTSPEPFTIENENGEKISMEYEYEPELVKFRYQTDRIKNIMSKMHKIYISKEGKKFAIPTLLHNSEGQLL